MRHGNYSENSFFLSTYVMLIKIAHISKCFKELIKKGKIKESVFQNLKQIFKKSVK